jgi:putative membrane protein
MARDWPLLFRIQGSVLRKIWLKIVITVVFSIGVILFDHHVLSIPVIEATFITVLGLVIGLLLVFRTSTGYER